MVNSDSREKANKIGEPYNHIDLLPAGIFQITIQASPSKQNTVISLSWGDREQNLKRSRQQIFWGWVPEKRTMQRRAPEICVRVPLTLLRTHTDLEDMWVLTSQTGASGWILKAFSEILEESCLSIRTNVSSS